MEAQETLRVVRSQPANGIFGWTVVVCGNLLLTLCVLTFARRLWGSFDTPLAAAALIAVGLTTILVPMAFRLMWQQLDDSRPHTGQRLVRLAVPSFGVVLLAYAVSLPGSPSWAVAVLWLMVAAGEGSAWAMGFPREIWDREQPVSAAAHIQEQPVGVPQTPLLDEEPEIPAGVSQQITRSHDDDGERVYGLLRCEIAPGERLRSLHVAFCPAFPAKPQLNAFQVDGPAATIKPAQVETFGARLELRLSSRAVERQAVVIEFEAHVAPQRASDRPDPLI